MPAIPVVADGNTIFAAHHDAIATELNGPWSTWTPVLTGTTTNPVLGSGSIQAGRYKQFATGLVVAIGQVAFGTSGASFGSGNYQVSFPISIANPSPMTAAIIGTAWIIDSSAGTGKLAFVRWIGGTTGRIVYDGGATTGITPTTPMTWAASDAVYYQIVGEPA